MTDNGLAALAQCGFVCGIPKDAHQTEEHPWEPLHLPDLCGHIGVEEAIAQGQRRLASSERAADAHIRAEIATLRAALDGLVAAVELTLAAGDPPAGWSHRKRADADLRAALAKAKGAGK